MDGMQGKRDLKPIARLDWKGNLEPVHDEELANRIFRIAEESRINDAVQRAQNSKNRRRINCVPLLLSLFLPWFLFLCVFAVVSFDMHYKSPATALLIPLTAVLSSWAFAWSTYKKFKAGKEVFFQAYISSALVASAALGWLLGDINFWFNVQPGLDIGHMATYSGVNPSEHTTIAGNKAPTRGARFQDAGTVYFVNDAYLDGDRSMGFKMGDVYCVAPIVSKSCTKNCGYDFWAIGVNCCSEDAADFRCAGDQLKTAKAGLRLTRDNQLPFFRLAVLEAEGAHKVRSTHPLFFEWIDDPKASIRAQMAKGYGTFVVYMFVYFVGNAIALFFCTKYKLGV